MTTHLKARTEWIKQVKSRLPNIEKPEDKKFLDDYKLTKKYGQCQYDLTMLSLGAIRFDDKEEVFDLPRTCVSVLKAWENRDQK